MGGGYHPTMPQMVKDPRFPKRSLYRISVIPIDLPACVSGWRHSRPARHLWRPSLCRRAQQLRFPRPPSDCWRTTSGPVVRELAQTIERAVRWKTTEFQFSPSAYPEDTTISPPPIAETFEFTGEGIIHGPSRPTRKSLLLSALRPSGTTPTR